MTYFIIDENLSFDFIPFLQKKGYVVDHVKKMGLGGTKNGDLYKIIERKKSWFITKDKDFSVKEKFEKYKVGGIIVLNLIDESTKNFIKHVEIVFDRLNYDFEEKRLILVRDKEVLVF